MDPTLKLCAFFLVLVGLGKIIPRFFLFVTCLSCSGFFGLSCG